MFIYDFFNYILAPFGIDRFVLRPEQLYTLFDEATTDKWQMLLSPQCLFSSILYFGIAFALWEILLVFPYRILKKWVHFPKKMR